MDNNSKNYIKLAVKTESRNFDEIRGRMDVQTLRLLHATMGMVTEAAEALDAMKKHIFYGRELDLINLFEECGDQLWYQAILLDVLGHEDFNLAMTGNINKLRARYPDKFQYKDANERDLVNERAVLETGFKAPQILDEYKSETRTKIQGAICESCGLTDIWRREDGTIFCDTCHRETNYHLGGQQ